MIIMSTYSGLVVYEGQKEEYQMPKGKVYKFQYAEPFAHN